MRVLLIALFAAALPLAAAPETIRVPPFPLPPLVGEGAAPTDVGAVHLLRDLQDAGLHGFDAFEAADNDYALFQHDSFGVLSTWLDSLCDAVHFDLRRARARSYDGTVFARLLEVATSLAALRGGPDGLAMPVGVVVCQRAKPWGALPADGAEDAYVIVATDTGMLVYDPPSHQLTALADFPNKATIQQIRF